ncbi:MAG: AcrB/AcrD/AcrF family protein [Verrucomicrobia bacterium]|nr:MAG: AcrB/AcrD/AcrF family protein [Verrucomicrobiota bacterium]
MIGWFTRNGVAANLLMGLILIMGIWALSSKLVLEVFPDFTADTITVVVPYRGSTPTEVEEVIVIRLEEAIQDLPGIKQMTSTASENAGSVRVEVAKGYDPREMVDDIKNRVDSINTFPAEAERPIVDLPARTDRVITVVVSGDLTERDLKRLGEQVRDEIANLPTVSLASLRAVRPYEIGIEVSEETLRKYNLTFDQVVRAVRNSSIDLSAGNIRTEGGEILLRTRGQAYRQSEFEEIVLIVRDDGTRLTLDDIAQVNDGFDEIPFFSRYNNRRAVTVDVFRVADQNVLDIATAVRDYVDEARTRMPAGVELGFWQDRSLEIKGRLNTLLGSAVTGGILVFLVLTLFLRFSLAVWVCLGIPVSFMGALAVMPYYGITINMVSVFAFILVLGIVVDDAIVTGENIFSHMQRGSPPLEAAINGTREVAVPVTFGVLTTVVAFIPLTMIEGTRGAIWLQIPAVVIPVLLFSLIESKLILPAHLKHLTNIGRGHREKLNPLARFQRTFADGLEKFVLKVYQPLLRVALRHRYLTLSIFTAILFILLAYILGGHLRFIFFPRVPSDQITVRLTMPAGTPVEITRGHIDRMQVAAVRLKDQLEEENGALIVTNVLSTVGGHPFGSRFGGRSGGGASEKGEINLELVRAEDRANDVTSMEVAFAFRREVGPIPGAEELTYAFARGGGGMPIDIQLNGPSFEALEDVADRIKEKLESYPGVFDIADSFEGGKDELLLTIKPEAEHLGLTVSDLARQVRQAFFGAEAQRIQRDRDDVRVMVRYPLEDRRSLASLETMRIRTRDGQEVPFSSVADVEMGKSLPAIRRIDRNRSINVRADVDYETADLQAIRQELLESYLPDLLTDYPATTFVMEGEAREQRESFSSLGSGMIFVMLLIYGMLAIPFKSYLQPLVVMSVIPFGLIGAILGHLILGYNLSVMSLFGCLALSGVVVNDSLVMVDYINRRRREGRPLMEAVSTAGMARFRPILLTSLTTFVGLTPLMLEESRQARFLIPMAISLAFGVLFATFITLFTVPANYLILEDARRIVYRLFGRSDLIDPVDSTESADR